MKKKRKNDALVYVRFVPFLLALTVFFITIGYSAFSDSLAIQSSSITVIPQGNVRVTGISLGSTSNGGTSSDEAFDEDEIISNIDLPNNNSTITYNVTIRNLGNIEMALASISGLPSNLTYTINNYTLKDALCDDADSTYCKLGSTTTLSITIGYVKNGYNSSNTSYSLDLDTIFESVVWVARIDNKYYERVQKAVEAVPTNDAETTIHVLESVTERINVVAHQNIVFDLDNVTLFAQLVGQASGYPVIETYGAVKVTNGIIYSAAAQGAINVQAGGSFVMTGGKIEANGTRQAIYNNGGTVSISGSANLSCKATERGAVQNLNNGTLSITGGTIISNNSSAVVQESGTLFIGTKDGTSTNSTPTIQGRTYGVYNFNGTSVTDFSFYDGSIKGRNGAIYDDTRVIDKEEDHGIVYSMETISGVEYHVATSSILSNTVSITFNINDGSGDQIIRNIEVNTAVGAIAPPTRENYVFDGWYTANDEEIVASTIASDNIVCYARWVLASEYYIAKIGDTNYLSLGAAVSAVTNNTTTTIELIRNTTENITIDKNRNIILDFGDKTLSSAGDAAVIIVKGNCTFISGSIYTESQTTAAINVEASGNFVISGGSISANGKRQAIYNNGGKVTISGDAYLRATTTERATVHNFKAGGTITITGGTIVSPYFSAVNNAAGTLNIGYNDGDIDITSPIIRGSIYGVTNSATFNWYDGKLYGVSKGYNGSVSDWDRVGTITNSTEQIDGITYKTSYLSIN